MFIGAEGTLGIITEGSHTDSSLVSRLTFRLVTIRLTPVLPTTVAVVHFPDVKHASEAVIDVLNRGVGIRKLLPLPIR